MKTHEPAEDTTKRGVFVLLDRELARIPEGEGLEDTVERIREQASELLDDATGIMILSDRAGWNMQDPAAEHRILTDIYSAAMDAAANYINFAAAVRRGILSTNALRMIDRAIGKDGEEDE